MAKSKYLRPRVEGDKPCRIEGCQYPLYAKGLCQPHYNRNRKYGDPLAGGTPWGAVRRWLDDVAVPYDGNECLTFPFGSDECGYGKVRISRTSAIGAHVYVLSKRDGQRPEGMECCHSCGNGHTGCVTFKHLRWDTHANNMADAKAHGTTRNGPRYGEDHHDFRATDDVVAKILTDLSAGMTQIAVAKKYGFGGTHISRIKNGWRRTQL